MKKQSLLAFVCILGCVATVACGPSQEELDATSTEIAADIFATQTALVTPTPTPTNTSTPTNTATATNTPTPTNTATITPTPLPDLSAARIILQDLPTIFAEMPLEIFGLDEEAPAFAELNLESIYAYAGAEEDSFEIILGFTALLSSAFEQTAYDVALTNPDLLLQTVMTGFISPGTDTNAVAELPLPELEDSANTSTGLTVTVIFEGGLLRVDFAMFRQDLAGVLIVVLYPDATVPFVSIHDLNQILKQRIASTQVVEDFTQVIESDSQNAEAFFDRGWSITTGATTNWRSRTSTGPLLWIRTLLKPISIARTPISSWVTSTSPI